MVWGFESPSRHQAQKNGIADAMPFFYCAARDAQLRLMRQLQFLGEALLPNVLGQVHAEPMPDQGP